MVYSTHNLVAVVMVLLVVLVVVSATVVGIV